MTRRILAAILLTIVAGLALVLLLAFAFGSWQIGP